MGAKRRRGVVALDAATRKENARRAGQMAHAKGTAHEFTSAEARAAGRKGGTALSRNRAHMAEIGRKGGCVAGNPSPANPLGVSGVSVLSLKNHTVSAPGP
jgi:general stress protein YciG